MEWQEALTVNPALAGMLSADDVIQVVYVHLEDGRQLIFLGPPMSENELEQVKTVIFGESVSTKLILAASRAIRDSELQ